MKDANCIFCKIIAGEIPGEPVYQDDAVVAIRDINPQAPVHLLILPRTHLASLAAATPEDMPLVCRLVQVAWLLAAKEKVAQRGYRVVINSGPEGDQVVPHLHVHLLGGRHLSGRIG
ncbi:MAG: histidine triad nucleotide-binding protein [Chloroflexi bacterium]|nr:histidine triad nucleotide-binding protein [Chloroflexota bacterium]